MTKGSTFNTKPTDVRELLPVSTIVVCKEQLIIDHLVFDKGLSGTVRGHILLEEGTDGSFTTLARWVPIVEFGHIRVLIEDYHCLKVRT